MRIKLYRTFVWMCVVVCIFIFTYIAGLSDHAHDPDNPDNLDHYEGLSSRNRLVKSQIRYRNPVIQDGGIDVARGELGDGSLVYHANDTRLNLPSSPVAEAVISQKCRPPGFAKEDTWQVIVPGTIFAFSAFFDDRQTKYGQLRIVGAQSRENGNVTLWCHMWKGNQMKAIKASRVRMLDTEGKRYVGILITCQLFTPFEPEVVSITPKGRGCAKSEHGLAVHNMPRRTKDVLNFTVCLSSVLTHHLVNHQQFVEWMEVQGLFGADHVVIYSQSESPTISPFITYYMGERQLSIVDWRLPFLNRDVYSYAELALLSDCMYRMMYTSKHVLFLHLNEFIVPRNVSTTWPDVLNRSRCSSRNQVLFRGAFFDGEASDDATFLTSNGGQGQLQLLTQAKTKRDERIGALLDGSRCMVQPEHIYTPGLAVVHRFLRDSETVPHTCYVEPTEALVHSYVSFKQTKSVNMVNDRTFHTFTKSIVSRVSKVFDRVDTVQSRV